MAVLIKSVDMPKCCPVCPCVSGFGHVCMAINRRFTKRQHEKNLDALLKQNEHRPSWCPLVEVPEPKRVMSKDEMEAAGFET